jgi:5-methylcytosine-specific restriction endonuclease McrA
MAAYAHRAGEVVSLECVVCGARFDFKKKSRGRYPRVCSDPCRAKQALLRSAAREAGDRHPYRRSSTARPTIAVACEHCGTMVPRVSNGKNRFCSTACQQAWHVAKARLHECKCPTCGQAFLQAIPRQRYCSDRCRRKLDWSERSHRRRSIVALGEPVSPELVFKRDGWRCQLCGQATPKRLRGSTDPRAPELDHIVPLSKGGEHSYLNAQCSCRACNLSKGSTIKGQLLLFG